jgi:hypothetical protein
LRFITYLCQELDSAEGISLPVPSLGDLVQLYNTPQVQAILPTTTTESSRVRRADERHGRSAVDVMEFGLEEEK